MSVVSVTTFSALTTKISGFIMCNQYRERERERSYNVFHISLNSPLAALAHI